MPTIPVSVVIPTFNRAATIERAIRSVQAQIPYTASEIIVSDDASTDETVEIATRLGVKVVHSTTNRGSGPTRNTGIDASAQPWIAFLDSDDEWLPDHLATVWEHSQNASFISTTAASVREGSIKRLLGCPTDKAIPLTSPTDLLVPENPVITSTVLLKRSLLNDAGGFRPLRRAQDLDLWIRVLERSSGLVLPRVTIRYYHGDDQATKDVALMERNRLDILASYSSSTWNTSSLAVRTTAARRWDSMRASLRRREHRPAIAQMMWMCAHPVALPVIMTMLKNRKNTRARTRAYLDQLQSADAIPTLAVR